jgi:hypothetical protein
LVRFRILLSNLMRIQIRNIATSACTFIQYSVAGPRMSRQRCSCHENGRTFFSIRFWKLIFFPLGCRFFCTCRPENRLLFSALFNYRFFQCKHLKNLIRRNVSTLFPTFANMWWRCTGF